MDIHKKSKLIIDNKEVKDKAIKKNYIIVLCYIKRTEEFSHSDFETELPKAVFGDKYMKLKRYGQTWELTPSFSKYYYNGRLTLALFEQDRSLFDVVTVNIEDEPITNENCSFIDTNNSGNEIITWLEENEFGKATGRFAVSGFCTYPEFEFKPDVIQKYKVEEIDIDL